MEFYLLSSGDSPRGALLIEGVDLVNTGQLCGFRLLL